MTNEATFENIIRDWVSQNFSSLECDHKRALGVLHVQYHNWTVFWVSNGKVWYRTSIKSACSSTLDPIEPIFFEKLKTIIELFMVDKDGHDNSIIEDYVSELMIRLK